jgi:hypothetical protein
VLFRAMKGDGSAADEAYVDIYADPLLGWGPRVDGEIAAHDVPGGHSSMLQEPHVGVLAQAMQASIDAALQRHAPGGPSTGIAAAPPADSPLVGAPASTAAAEVEVV